jgi:hypothetical protein
MASEASLTATPTGTATHECGNLCPGPASPSEMGATEISSRYNEIITHSLDEIINGISWSTGFVALCIPKNILCKRSVGLRSIFFQSENV